jgi:hypothetical protein
MASFEPSLRLLLGIWEEAGRARGTGLVVRRGLAMVTSAQEIDSDYS